MEKEIELKSKLKEKLKEIENKRLKTVAKLLQALLSWCSGSFRYRLSAERIAGRG